MTYTDRDREVARKAAELLAPLIDEASKMEDSEETFDLINGKILDINDEIGPVDYDEISDKTLQDITVFEEGLHDFTGKDDMIDTMRDIVKSLRKTGGIEVDQGKERTLPEEQELERDENMSENSKLDMLEREIDHIQQQEEPKQDADTDRLEFCIAEQMKSGKVSREEAVNMCKRQRSVGMEDGVAMAQQSPPEAEVQGAPMAVDDASMANGMYQQLTPMKMATGVISASATPFTALWSEISDDMNKILERLERIIAGNPGG